MEVRVVPHEPVDPLIRWGEHPRVEGERSRPIPDQLLAESPAIERAHDIDGVDRPTVSIPHLVVVEERATGGSGRPNTRSHDRLPRGVFRLVHVVGVTVSGDRVEPALDARTHRARTLRRDATTEGVVRRARDRHRDTGERR